ncbi:MAG: NAD(P)-dependent oxidoreductase [bacterium]
MRIAVFGGSRGIGAKLLPMAVDREWGCKVLARSAPSIPEIPGVQVIEGNVLDPGAVFRTLDGCDAAVITLGKSRNNPVEVCSEGTRIVTEVMKKLGVRRVVAVTSMGVGDSADQVPFIFKVVMKTVLKKVMLDKERQEQFLRDSGLEWVIVRPGGLTDAPATGNYKAGTDTGTVASKISREDVASFMLDQLAFDTYLHRCPYIT